jgi:hypothetical protein
MRKRLGKLHKEDQEGDGRITLKFILSMYVVKMRDGLNWLKIVPNGVL